MSDRRDSNAGVFFLVVLTLLFVVLKLNPGEHLTSQVVEWPWWLIFLPLWGPVALGLSVGVIILTLAYFVDNVYKPYRLKKRLEKRRKKMLERNKLRPRG